MKALLKSIILGTVIFSVSSEVKAQLHLPQKSNPKSDNYYFKKQFYSPVKQLMMNDSLTWTGLDSRLNINTPAPKIHVIPETGNAISSPGKIPANPKDYMNKLDINGNNLYLPKSSLSLMTY